MSENLADYIKEQDKRIRLLEAMVNEIGFAMRGARKKKFNKKTQTVAWSSMHRALCVDTLDPFKENRVRFYSPVFHHPLTPVLALPWARPVSSMGGFDDCGLNWVPPAGSTLVLFFENAHRDAPFYTGTTWHRNRGPGGSKLNFPVQEYINVSNGHRKGYLVGANDESQVLPPWNTESYNNFDSDSFLNFATNTDEQQRMTYPNIYGFKTPEKHMVKMVDGNAQCDRRYKRFELMSSCGNWFIMKDDHLHYGGQWSNPSCNSDPGGPDESLCATKNGSFPYFTDPNGKPIEMESTCQGKQSSDLIIGGHPSTPTAVDGGTKYKNSNKGTNKYFKHQNECRPYRGPGTPQNNRCDLPQTGFQLLSIAGHSIVADDSVEEPRGAPLWERGIQDFDFGCNDKFVGLFYIKSATGHKFMMSDVEADTGLRGDQNYVQLLSAAGNRIELNDHTIGQKGCDIGCPPNYAGEQRGVFIESSSTHHIFLCDNMNNQCSPCRMEGGTPANNATQAYIEIKSGYGLEMQFRDDNSQQQTQSQWIQILHPQSANGADPYANTGPGGRGPHFLRFQGRPKGSPGIVYLRAGGHAIRQTYDMDIVLVGDKENNPSDKFTYVSRMNIRATEDVDFRYSGKMHILFAEDQVLLMAGRDCPPAPKKKCRGPCLYPVVVGRCPIICPYTGFVHWTEKALSERVFASAKNTSICTGGDGETTLGQPPPCTEDNTTSNINTGNGNVTVNSPGQPGTTQTGSGASQIGEITDPGSQTGTIYTS